MLHQRQTVEKLQNCQTELECVSEKNEMCYSISYIYYHFIVSFLLDTVGSDIPNTTVSQIYFTLENYGPFSPAHYH